jgi:hypothetical protein
MVPSARGLGDSEHPFLGSRSQCTRYDGAGRRGCVLEPRSLAGTRRIAVASDARPASQAGSRLADDSDGIPSWCRAAKDHLNRLAPTRMIGMLAADCCHYELRIGE